MGWKFWKKEGAGEGENEEVGWEEHDDGDRGESVNYEVPRSRPEDYKADEDNEDDGSLQRALSPRTGEPSVAEAAKGEPAKSEVPGESASEAEDARLEVERHQRLAALAAQGNRPISEVLKRAPTAQETGTSAQEMRPGYGRNVEQSRGMGLRKGLEP
ncbi:hypothetical protein ACFYOG_36670 [Streptomyces sp. NPDC007818]|uniref:hypothetical protein n=1 Tax=Streptomyces sp. NPDC007818 TaxID=3364780 RepID=UPI003679E72E